MHYIGWFTKHSWPFYRVSVPFSSYLFLGGKIRSWRLELEGSCQPKSSVSDMRRVSFWFMICLMRVKSPEHNLKCTFVDFVCGKSSPPASLIEVNLARYPREYDNSLRDVMCQRSIASLGVTKSWKAKRQTKKVMTEFSFSFCLRFPFPLLTHFPNWQADNFLSCPLYQTKNIMILYNPLFSLIRHPAWEMTAQSEGQNLKPDFPITSTDEGISIR
jgi:hypothetical protein